MKKIKYIIFILIAAISSVNLNAQIAHEFSGYGAMGMSTLKYSTTFGQQTNGFGGLFGGGYTFFLTESLGVNTGFEFSFYNAKMAFDNLTDNYMTVDFEGNEFDFHSAILNYKEKQTTMYLNIPLMLYYQNTAWDENKYYFGLGVKFGFPVMRKYKTNSDAAVRATGYYDDEEYDYDQQFFLGFGEFPMTKVKRGLDMKVAYMLSAEAGIKWKLNFGENMSLYTGLYFDYGLNNVNKNSTTKKPFVIYDVNKPREYATNGVFSSEYTFNRVTNSFVDKVTPIAVGVKIRFSFGIEGGKGCIHCDKD